jgi:uncharacterized protein (UPF0303 family)
MNALLPNNSATWFAAALPGSSLSKQIVIRSKLSRYSKLARQSFSAACAPLRTDTTGNLDPVNWYAASASNSPSVIVIALPP